MNFLRKLFPHNTSTPTNKSKNTAFPITKEKPNISDFGKTYQPSSQKQEDKTMILQNSGNSLTKQLQDPIARKIESGDFRWGCLVGVMNSEGRELKIIPNDCFWVQVDKQVGLMNLRNNSLDTFLVLWADQFFKTSQLISLLLSQQRLVFEIQKEKDLEKFFKGYQTALMHPYLVCAYEQCPEILSYNIYKTFDVFLVQFHKHTQFGNIISKVINKCENTSNQNELISDSVFKDNWEAKEKSTFPEIMGCPYQNSRPSNKESSELIKTVEVTLSSEQNLINDDDMDIQDLYFANNFSCMNNQPSGEPMDQLLQIYYFNQLANESDIQEEQEQVKTHQKQRRQRSRSQGNRLQLKDNLLDDQFFNRQ